MLPDMQMCKYLYRGIISLALLCAVQHAAYTIHKESHASISSVHPTSSYHNSALSYLSSLLLSTPSSTPNAFQAH
jgi:hypothetical protein